MVAEGAGRAPDACGVCGMAWDKHGDDATCYAIGYELEKARADKAWVEGWSVGRDDAARAALAPWSDLGDRPPSPPAAVLSAEMRIRMLAQRTSPTPSGAKP